MSGKINVLTGALLQNLRKINVLTRALAENQWKIIILTGALLQNFRESIGLNGHQRKHRDLPWLPRSHVCSHLPLRKLDFYVWSTGSVLLKSGRRLLFKSLGKSRRAQGCIGGDWKLHSLPVFNAESQVEPTRAP